MSAMTITVGTGLQGGANRSGYAHDDLSRYPDLAFSEGYVFRAGTGWWQEWESIFPTYNSAAASDVSTNYAAKLAEAEMYVSNLGTGWTAPYSGLFPSSETTGQFPAKVSRLWSLRECPPYVSTVPMLPNIGMEQSMFAQGPEGRSLQLGQSDPSKRPLYVPNLISGYPGMSFSGSQWLAGGSVQLWASFSVDAVVVVFRTPATPIANTTLLHVLTAGSSNVGFEMGISSDSTAAKAALSTSPTVVASPVPSTPTVAVNDGQLHVFGIAHVLNTPTLFINTDGTIQDWTGTSLNLATVSGVITIGANSNKTLLFTGDIVEVYAFNDSMTSALLTDCVNAIKARWGIA